jgi:RHS repeat-associated protein
VQTDYEGVVEQTCTNLPYGNGQTCSATPTEELYAGLERDSATNLDNAVYRSYTSAFGRWTTPDPYDGSYDWNDPQSLNRYAYVNGRPMRFTDPSGQMPIPCPSGLPTSGFDPEFGPVLIANACDDGIMAIGAGGWLASVAPYVGPIAELGLAIYDLGKAVGLWGQKPQFKGNVKASQQGKNVPSHNTAGCKTGFGAGITIGADAGAGVGVTGAGANGSVGAALFGGNGINAGVFASGGAGANFLSHTASAVTQLISANFFGAGGGVGGGIFLTNASQASQLAGPSATWNVDLGWVANGAAQFSQGADAAGNSIYTFGFTLGYGGGAVYHNVTDTTVAKGTGSGCE